MQFLTILKTILTLLPLLIEAVKAIEAAVPQGGQGAAKLDLIRQTLQAGYEVASDATVKFEAIWPALQSVIGSVVTLFNATGAFKK
jgi:hypothetical protein